MKKSAQISYLQKSYQDFRDELTTSLIHKQIRYKDPISKKEVKIYNCPYCDKTFSQEELLKIHILRMSASLESHF